MTDKSSHPFEHLDIDPIKFPLQGTVSKRSHGYILVRWKSTCGRYEITQSYKGRHKKYRAFHLQHGARYPLTDTGYTFNELVAVCNQHYLKRRTDGRS